MSTPRDWLLDVLGVEPHARSYFSLRLTAPSGLLESRAGQFVMVEVGDRLEPYLRRAFSVHDVSRVAGDGASSITLLGKVVGRGTALLAAARPGDALRVLGPLGRPFAAPTAAPVALVAGGVGCAPLLLLARQLLAADVPFDVLYGGRRRSDLARSELFAELAESAGGCLLATTEDGSHGEAGLVTAPLERGLTSGRYRSVYTCGPMPMMAAVARLALRHGVEGEAALETAMGCGFGACLGCVVPLANGHLSLCCKDGPPFRFDEVQW